jgi:nitrilase
VREVVKVACVQAEPAIFDREATIDRLGELAAEARGNGAQLAVFPEAFIPVYPSSRWARYLAGWTDGDAKSAYARLARESLEIPSPAATRIGEIAREHSIWLAVGANELAGGTIYNALLLYGPDGGLAIHHRKLVPTNHERLVWGQGDGRGLDTVDIGGAKVGGLICWENLMPLARFALYERGVEIYLAPTAEDSDGWLDSMRHIARESRSFVVAPSHFQRAASYPADFPLRDLLDGVDVIGRGGSAILDPGGAYLAGPLYDEEGILYAELDPARLWEERQRFDPAGHYHRPDVLQLAVTPRPSAATPAP